MASPGRAKPATDDRDSALGPLPRATGQLREFTLIYYWSVAQKAQFIVLATIAVQAIIVLVTGTAYLLDHPAFPFAPERNLSAIRCGGASIALMVLVLVPVRWAALRQRHEGAALWLTTAATVPVLAVDACLLGVFESLTWVVFCGYFVTGFITLGARPVLGMFGALMVLLVAATQFHAYLPFGVYLYALPGSGTLGALPAQVVLVHWAMASIGIVISVGVMVYLLGAWQTREQALHGKVRVDTLTALLNRRAIVECLEYEIERVRRGDGPLAIAMIDIDRFKQINDRHGHLRGDAILAHVAAHIGASLRAADAAGRYGGEEFLIVLPKCALGGAATTLARLMAALASEPHALVGAEPLAVTISAGVAEHRPEDDLVSMIDRADRALYLAKKSGRNCVRMETDL